LRTFFCSDVTIVKSNIEKKTAFSSPVGAVNVGALLLLPALKAGLPLVAPCGRWWAPLLPKPGAELHTYVGRPIACTAQPEGPSQELVAK
jgi:hypothetical protein